MRGLGRGAAWRILRERGTYGLSQPESRSQSSADWQELTDIPSSRQLEEPRRGSSGGGVMEEERREDQLTARTRRSKSAADRRWCTGDSASPGTSTELSPLDARSSTHTRRLSTPRLDSACEDDEKEQLAESTSSIERRRPGASFESSSVHDNDGRSYSLRTPIFETPKSVSLMWPSRSMSMLSGLRSRWTMPLEWRNSRARAVSAVYTLALFSSRNAELRNSAQQSPPGRYSITMYKCRLDWNA
mmetsp:Transcript_26427/g.45495  ORF Transcript_26427/g.45495 Transcript_26427/m.45495 type:complete len:245 (+) Transcript_26427:1964-2698(+)